MDRRLRRQNRIALALAPLTVAVCLLAIYALRGIYPFGALTVAQGDLEQQYCAMYTQLYDVLQGKASPLFSWLTALGRGQSMDMMIFGCASPLNLLFLLVPRDALLANMSYFVLLKLALCALTAAWYVQKRFPSLSPVWSIFFGVAYGLSGHALMHFHNTLWLEAMILLPVYLYYGERMLCGGKVLPYALLLAALLLINFYPAAMVCLFTFVAGGAYIVLLLPPGSRGKATLRIVAGTLLAFALSAFRTAPAGWQMLHAARLGYEGASLFMPFSGYSWVRGFALATACFALVLLPWRLHSLIRAGEKRKAAFMGVLLGAMLLPLFFDGVDMLWHFGGNIGFAHRFGFITVFVVLAFSAEALVHWETRERPVRSKGWARILQYAVLAGVLLCFAYCTLRDGRRATDFLDWNQALLAVLTLAAAAAYLGALLLPERRLARALCLAILLLQTGCYGYSAFVAEDTVSLASASATQAAALSAVFPETDDISRVKVEDASLTINYPKYLGRPALSSFSSSTEAATLEITKAMGYGISAYAIQDCGGTLFSDALLHVTSTVSLSDRFLSDDAYAFRTQVGPYYVYDNAYTLPFGLVGNGSALQDLNHTDYTDCFRFQNAIYAALSGDNAPLFTEAEAAFAAAPKEAFDRYYTQIPTDGYGAPVTAFAQTVISVLGQQRVYLYNRGVAGAKLCALVERDGEVVRRTELHPITYLDGIYDLGEYSDTTITVTVAADAETAARDVVVALMDVDKLAAFTHAASDAPAVTDVQTGKRTIHFSVEAKADDDVLFLPMLYSGNWRVQLDQTKCAPVRVVENYLGVILPQGAHEVEMRYWPAGLTAGIVCSVLALAASVFVFLRERTNGVLFADAPERVTRVAGTLLTVVWWIAILLCYALPVAYAMAFWYKNLH